ncbi:TMEM175 family protein [Flavihumibacter solisilvae]|uniref:DUF1211 domain-containing protein n=1 Tax=Flavihumibacter solisilvae TaxID=1349421 RepID=A0A0C1L375_9BACT|nr:TMEM175 family protein [Flavihumibacter solisilvae]KIC94432.1 hypothetical protein OI18_12565 [Flavihumibacter solisilvae]
MTTTRLEAFSDGVLAIVITIMVLELKVPHGAGFADLKPVLPKFLSYIFSFIYVGIYWNNHHHMFHAIKKINGKVLWANLLVLFCLSLLPFTTDWMGENLFAKNTVALYGFNLLACSLSFILMERLAIQHEGGQSTYAKAVSSLRKERLSLTIYVVGTLLSFFLPIVSLVLFYIVAIMWVIPDTRIEKTLD